MTPLEIAGQIISILAMACNILSYQQKNQRVLIAYQLIGGALFATSYFMLGAMIGGILNIVAVIRAVIFIFRDKFNAGHPAWLYGFVACYIAFYILTFTVFGVEPSPISLIVEILPIVGMTALSVGFMREDSGNVRKLGLVSSPAWLIYNIYHLSVGAIICESISLVSIIIGILRHDRENKDKQDGE